MALSQNRQNPTPFQVAYQTEERTLTGLLVKRTPSLNGDPRNIPVDDLRALQSMTTALWGDDPDEWVNHPRVRSVKQIIMMDKYMQLLAQFYGDRSGSMGAWLDQSGKTRISEVNRGIKQYANTIYTDGMARRRSLAQLIPIGGNVDDFGDFARVDKLMQYPPLQLEGDTPLYAASIEGNLLLVEQICIFKTLGLEFLPPVQIYLCDGGPTDGKGRDAWRRDLAVRLSLTVQYGLGANVWAVAVGAPSQVECFALAELNCENQYYEMVDDAKIDEVFNWASRLTKSLSSIQSPDASLEADDIPESVARPREGDPAVTTARRINLRRAPALGTEQTLAPSAYPPASPMPAVPFTSTSDAGDPPTMMAPPSALQPTVPLVDLSSFPPLPPYAAPAEQPRTALAAADVPRRAPVCTHPRGKAGQKCPDCHAKLANNWKPTI